MLINVFSLHRTGSTWYSHYLKNKYPNGELYNEWFNQLQYFKLNPDNSFTPQSEYSEGCFFRAPNEAGTELVHVFRELTPEDDVRFDKLLTYLKRESQTKTIVIHTHLTPLRDEDILLELSKAGDKNYYVYRENTIEQLASYTLLLHTGEYGAWTKDRAHLTERYEHPIVDVGAIEWLCNDIMRAEALIERKIVNFERIKYESMPFEHTIDGMPLKQNVSAFNRLCMIDQLLINQIYERVKNGKENTDNGTPRIRKDHPSRSIKAGTNREH
jgi:hypothetical protein